MFTIEKKHYGYRFAFSGFITADEMTRWLEEVKKILSTPQSKEFGVFVDMQEMKPLADEVQKIIVEGQAICKTKGMGRSVVILKSSVLSMQFRRLAKESGIYEWERYLASQNVANYEKVGEDWIVSGTDPDIV
jgi:hypothetical protein